jgi:hypothetical protein
LPDGLFTAEHMTVKNIGREDRTAGIDHVLAQRLDFQETDRNVEARFMAP